MANVVVGLLINCVIEGRGCRAANSIRLVTCGRTDFQNGSADDLFHSVRDKLFSLPDDTLVYPGHDYHGRRVSTIAQEKRRNPRLGEAVTLERFRSIMAELDLPYPKFIDHAVPGNRQCGVCPSDLSESYRKYCEQVEHSPQG